MARTSCFAVAFLLAGLLQSTAFAAPSATAGSGKLRWVRGEVTAVSAGSLTLKLRNKLLTITLDDGAPPAVGDIVEAHYSDKHGDRRAVLIFTAGRSAELSKRPGTSYRGIVKRITRSNVSLTANDKLHGISLAKKTRLVDADGRPLASGSKEIAGLLPPGEDVVVKYEDDGGTMMIGDTILSAGSDQALEIRKLR